MLSTGTPAEAQQLRGFLSEADYTEAGFRRRPWLLELPTRHSGNLPWLLDCTEALTPFHALVRLFTFGLAQSAARVNAAVPANVMSIMQGTGLISARGEEIAPNYMLTPLDDKLIAADAIYRMYPEPEPDLILWSNNTTRMLERARLRGPSKATLDLGTGCGVIAVFAADSSERVVATDLNARAAEFVPFNAWINGVSNVETLIGDTFAPVEGRKFDRILANPPFFVAPSSEVMYCENPLELDSYCRRVVREGADHLEESGFLQMVFEWVQVKGQPWQERLAEWVEGTGCDVWVLQTYAGTPDAYAHQRSCRDYADSPEKATEKFHHWMRYYRERDVQEIRGGILAARKRAGRNWLRIEEGRIDTGAPFGDLIREIFETQDVLDGQPSDEQMLATRPRLAAGAALEQEFVVENGKWAFTSLKLSLKHSLPASLAVESQVADFLARCDGTRTLRELAEALASSVKAPPEQVRAQCCAIVKRLAARRMLSLGRDAGRAAV
jgi:methylase of polypeptide subunit release factors